jgi:uncharacterized protein YjdB
LNTRLVRHFCSAGIIALLTLFLACGGSSSSTKSGPTVNTTVTLKSITLSATAGKLSVGSTRQFTATGTYSDGTTKDLTSTVAWSSSNTTVAQVNASGLVTAQASGSTTILGTLGGVSGASSVTVNAALNTITISPSPSANVPTGQTLQFSASGTYSDASTAVISSLVAWSSSDSTIATVDANGLVTGVAPGSVQITASLSGVSASVSVQVQTTLLSISVTPANPAIELNTTQPLAASGTFSDGTEQDLTNKVTWTSSDTSKATIDTTGLVTAVASGSSTITAAMNGVTGTTSLTVDPPQLASIIVDQDGDTVPLGLPDQLTATGVFNDGSTATLFGVSFTSSDPTIVSVDANGLAASNAVGAVTITATLGSVSGTGILTVGPQTLVSMAVTPTNPTIPLGLQQQFVVTGTFTDSSTQQLTDGVTWVSSDPTVASVDANGLASSVALGSSTITANVGALSSSGSLTVTAAQLVSVAVTPTSASIPVAVTQQFTATGTYDDASTQDLSSTVTWVSSNGALATISNTGVATALAPGNVTITASSGAISGTAALQVNTATITGLTITPVDQTAKKGTWVRFTATATYSDGSSRAITSGVAWSSSKPSVAHINGSGRARAHKNGVVTITAKFGGSTTTTTLTVTN